jgi:hypothetical protein
MAVRPAAFRRRSVLRKAASALLESLETRQFLSTVNVVDFGAVANDGNDDSPAIQKALDASKAGDTVVFPGGTFDLKSGMSAWPSSRTYQGQNNAALKGNTNKGQLVTFRGDDVTLSGLTFVGGGVFFDRSNGFNQNVVIDNNIFRLDTKGENNSAVTFTSGLKHAQITNNYVTGYNGGFGIYGYNYNDLEISNNEFVDVSAGMHIDAFGSSGNLLVEQNYISGAKGMGMEFQGAATNLTFQDNWFENPNLSSERKRNGNSMAFSLILDKSSDIEIRRNVVMAPQRPDGIGCRIAFEVGGDDTVVEDNYVDGVNHVLAVNDGVGTCDVTAKNNVFKNYLEGPRISFPSNNPRRSYEQSNNGPGVALTWNISRGKPGRNHRLDGTAAPAGEPTTVVPPTVIPVSTTPPPADNPGGNNDGGDSGSGDSGSGDQNQNGGGTQPASKPTTPIVAPQFPSGPTKTTPNPAIPAPSAPRGLRAKAFSAVRVDLTWTDTANNETGFAVERSLDGVQWKQVGVTGSDAVKFSNLSVGAGLRVYYRVRAFNAGGTSAYSSVAMVTTPQLPTPQMSPSVVTLPPGTSTTTLRPPKAR